MDKFDKYKTYNPGQELQASFEQIQQSSEANDCGELSITEEKMSKAAYSRAIRHLSHEERFKNSINTISTRLNNNEIFDISVNDKNTMCRLSDKLININASAKYINPTAYILGYLSIKETNEIDDDEIKNIFSKLNRLQDDSIKEPDVIRYSRFVKKLIAS